MLGKLPTETKERPVLNSTFIPTITSGEPRSLNLDTLMYWVKSTPECIGIVKRIATDIVTKFDFIAIDSPNKSGRPKKNYDQLTEDKAYQFSRRNFFRQKLISGVMDWLITGDAYLWKGRLSEAQIKEILTKHYSDYNMDYKEFEHKQFFDEDWNGVNAVEIIPSSMVEIIHDHLKVIQYIQKSKTAPDRDRKFSPDEVIHAKFMELDGKVYGYSPMESSYTAIKTINAIQDYNYNYFANGVKLNRAWMFSGMINQSYLDAFQETIEKYQRTRYAQGDIIVAGGDKINVETLNQVSDEMQHRQLAINVVGRLAFAFNMPADILSSILGVDVKSTAIGSDIEDAGYNRNIEQSKQYWEDLLNTQLFNKEFKVNIKFDRQFLQDKIKLSQYQTQTVPFIEFLFKHKVPVTDEYIIDMLNIPREYRDSGKIKREVELPTPIMNKPNPKGPQQQALSDAKKRQQEPQQNISPQNKELKEVTYLNPDTFLDELRRWGVNSDSLHRPRIMRKGNKIYVKFSVPNTGEEIRTVISAKDYDSFDWMELSPLTVTALWDDDLKKILKPTEKPKKKPKAKKDEVQVEKFETDNLQGTVRQSFNMDDPTWGQF